MTTKAVKALFWKEYRQQIMLLVAVFLLGIIFQLSTYTMNLFQPSSETYFWTLGMFATALYAAGAAGVLFAREHDEKTFGFLRSLPMTADTILVGKLAWLLGSTLLLGIVMGLESLLWVAAAGGTHDSGASIFGVMGVAVVEALCWGLFWSVRSKSQLNSLLATFLSASVGAYVMAVLWSMSFGGGNNEIIDAYASGAPLRLLLAGVVGAIAVTNARKWLYRQFDKPLDTLTTEQLAVQSQKMSAPPKRGEMRWLIWHAFRQSRASFGYLAVVFAMMIALLVATYTGWFVSDTVFELAVFLGIAAFVGLVFCSSVFFRDQQNKAAAMLTNVGVSPGKLWWSRILVFGLAYAIYCVPLVVAYLTVAVGKNGEFFRFFLCYEPEYHAYIWQEITDVTIRRQSLFVAVTLFASIFCFGQMISLYLRSVLAAMAVVVGMFCGVFFWIMAVKYLLGYAGLIWAVWPILLACLVGSRIRTANWQRGRNTWRAWRTPLSVVVIPAIVILCVIPFIRVYSVPTIYLGYMADPSGFSREIDLAANEKRLSKLRIYTPRDVSLQEIKEYLDAQNVSIASPQFAIRDLGIDSRHIYWKINAFITSENITPEKLKELIAVMEHYSAKRPPLREVIARNYEIEYRDALYGTTEGYEKGRHNRLTYVIPLVKKPLWYRIGLPWEKHRIMRRLNYEFQVQSQLADEIDQLVYHNQGNFEQIDRKADVLRHTRTGQHREVLPQQHSMLFGDYYWDSVTRPHYVYDNEIKFRVRIIELALQAYHLEHGELPETLAELEGEYLTRVPTMPATGDAFLYFPHPDPEILEEGNRIGLGEEYRGVPHLRAPKYRFDYYGNEGPVYHLEFLRKPKAKTEE